MSSQNPYRPRRQQGFKDKIFCVGIICNQYIVHTRLKNTKKISSSFIIHQSWIVSRPYMEVKTALAFFFDTFLFQIMPTNATVAVHLDFLYATQFPTILIQTKIKMIALHSLH